MSRDYRLYLDDIKTSCEKILDYTKNMSRDEFFTDPKTFDAVIRNLEIIGESTKQLPQAVKDRYPEVEWAKVAGLRNLIVHHYFGIDEDIIWDIIINHVPVLKVNIDHILNFENPA